MTLQDTIAYACDAVPGLLSSALVMLPEGIVIAGHSKKAEQDAEPLARAAASRVGKPPRMPHGLPATLFVEYAFVNEDQLVVIERSERDARVALVVACDRDVNFALVLESARSALRKIEASMETVAKVA